SGEGERRDLFEGLGERIRPVLDQGGADFRRRASRVTHHAGRGDIVDKPRGRDGSLERQVPAGGVELTQVKAVRGGQLKVDQVGPEREDGRGLDKAAVNTE